MTKNKRTARQALEELGRIAMAGAAVALNQAGFPDGKGVVLVLVGVDEDGELLSTAGVQFACDPEGLAARGVHAGNAGAALYRVAAHACAAAAATADRNPGAVELVPEPS